MCRTFNFKQSQTLLDVDPKTFARWLKKAGIDPSKQINLADPREKYLTEEQILMLAKEHGREVHFPPEEQSEDTKAEVSLATLNERLTMLEQGIVQRLEEMTGLLASLEERITQGLGSQVKAAQATTPASPAPRSSPPKEKAKGKGLPIGYTPLRVFARVHGVSVKAADHASKSAKIAVKSGKWLYKSRYIFEALDARGKHDFYELFHERESFQRCNRCPHALS